MGLRHAMCQASRNMVGGPRLPQPLEAPSAISLRSALGVGVCTLGGGRNGHRKNMQRIIRPVNAADSWQFLHWAPTRVSLCFLLVRRRGLSGVG